MTTSIPGVLFPWNTTYGVERDDEAETFDGDLEAAAALAAAIGGGVVKFLRNDGVIASYIGGDLSELPEGIGIASGTDPWIERDGKIVAEDAHDPSKWIDAAAFYAELEEDLPEILKAQEPRVVVVCDNCGKHDPPLTTAEGRFCDQGCADAYSLR